MTDESNRIEESKLPRGRGESTPVTNREASKAPRPQNNRWLKRDYNHTPGQANDGRVGRPDPDELKPVR
jgi:hypothetical protein